MSIKAKMRKKYIITYVVAGDTIEVYKTQSTRFQEKIPRGDNRKKTPKAMEKVNQENAERVFRQLVNTNFRNNDFHVIFTYMDEFLPSSVKQAKKDLQLHLRRLKYHLKKQGVELKYISVTEEGEKSGRLHHHAIINAEAALLINELWHYGKVELIPLYTDGQYGNLSNYLAKDPDGRYRTSAYVGKRWNQSKNLKMPTVVPKVVSKKEWDKPPAIPEEIKGLTDFNPEDYDFDPMMPTVEGIFEDTGFGYQRYGLIKTKVHKGKKHKARASRSRAENRGGAA